MNEHDTRSVAPEVTYVEGREKRTSNKLVLVSSILLALAGLIIAVMYILAYFFIVKIPDFNSPPIPTITLILVLLFNVELYFGIYGVVSANKPKRGKVLMILGLIMVGMHVFTSVQHLMDGHFSVALGVGLILKIIYTWGGYQLYKEYSAGRHQNYELI